MGFKSFPVLFIFFILIFVIAVLKVYDLPRKDDVSREYGSSRAHPEPVPPLSLFLFLRQLLLWLGPAMSLMLGEDLANYWQ